MIHLLNYDSQPVEPLFSGQTVVKLSSSAPAIQKMWKD